MRILILMVLLVGAACTALPGQAPPPTPIPYNLYGAQDVLAAFSAAGLSVLTPIRAMSVGRDAPDTFSDRYTFAIEGVAPEGGQVLVFDTPDALAAWLAYIEGLRASSVTRRTVSYVYTHRNILIQINADLPPRTAQAYRDALTGMG